MPVHTSIWFWIAFHLGVFIALALDLASFKRRARALSMRAATQRSALWMVLSFGFCALIWQWQSPERGLDFLTGYLIEYSLSVDNIFVFVLIFTYFRVPPIAQHRDHARPVYRLYVEHLRHSRLALAVFPAREPDRSVHLSENRPRARASVCWNQNDCGALFSAADSAVARRHCAHPCRHHYGLDDCNAKPDPAGESKMKCCFGRSKFV